MTARATKPLIGIPCGYLPKSEFSRTPHYALTKRFCDAVAEAGGLPLMLPYNEELIADYIAQCDGFILPDGRYRYREDFYDKAKPTKFATDTVRGPFDITFTKAVLDSNKPVLGVCAGMQNIAAAFGTSFYEDVRKDKINALDHLEPPAEEPVHKVEINPDSKLADIFGVTELAINTSHREAIKHVGDSIVVSALCTDGVIEAIELPEHPFAIGVQWHPEFYDCFPPEVAAQHQKLFKALVDAC